MISYYVCVIDGYKCVIDRWMDRCMMACLTAASASWLLVFAFKFTNIT